MKLKMVCASLTILFATTALSVFSQSTFAGAKTHSVFFKSGKINCPAVAYYTSMSTSSSTTSDSCENVTWIVKNHREEQERFVSANYSLLEQQVSQGRGELVVDYANLMDCPHAPAEFGEALRNNFDKVFSADRSEDRVLNESESILRQHPELAKKCLAGA